MSIYNALKKGNGFTTLELIVVISIVSIITLGLNSIILSGYSHFRFLNDKAEIQRSIRLIESILDNNIRYAKSIKINSSTVPAENSNYDQTLTLSKKKDNLHRLMYNGKYITNNIVEYMNEDLNNKRLELEIKFSNNHTVSFYTILANLDSK